MTPDFAPRVLLDGERAEMDRAPAPVQARSVAPTSLRPEAIFALQRGAGNAAVTNVPARHARASPTRATMQFGDAKVWFYWGAGWWPKAGPNVDVSDRAGLRELKLPVQAGSTGKLIMRLVAHVSPALRMPGKAALEWRLMSRCQWTVTVGADGILKIGDPAPSFAPARDSMLQQTGAPQGSANKDMRQFTLTQGYVGGTESVDVNYGPGGTSTTKPAATGGESFVISLEVQGDRQPEPQVEIGKVQVFQRQTWDVHFFRDKNTKVSADERKKLMAWFAGLSKLTRGRLKAGTQKMRLETYASNAGPADKNQLTYAQRRLDSVQAILKRLVTDWEATPFGEDKRPDDADLAPAEERREQTDPSRLIAHLEVEDERTPGADADNPFDLLPKD